MDDFTPPPPRPRANTNYSYTSPPPPIPPPPRDLPHDYRASIDMRRPSTSADTMYSERTTRPHTRSGSQQKYFDPPLSPSIDGSVRSSSQSGFKFLSRSRSGRHQVPVVTSAEGHTMLRKSKVKEQEAARLRKESEEARERRPPPTLPSHAPFPAIDNFGGEDYDSTDARQAISSRASNFSRPVPTNSNMANSSSMPILSKQHQSPPQQQHRYSPNAAALARDQSAAFTDNGYSQNKHYSIASTSMSTFNSPRRVRRRKDPTPFNILVVGARNSGKTSLIEFLKSSLALPIERQPHPQATPTLASTDGSFTSDYVETEFEGERVGVTLWDSKGLERNLVDLQIREMSSFIESKFEDTFNEESKVNRSPGYRDTHIHCVFLVLDPASLDLTLRASKVHTNGNAFAQARGPSGLSQEVDMLVMKGLAGKTTVIPIISKADTLTGAHINYLKRAVWNSIQAEKLDPLDALGLEESESEFDDEEVDEQDSDEDISDAGSGLPIQSTGSNEGDMSFPSPGGNKTRSSATTPSPGQPLKHPNARNPSRSITPGHDNGGTGSEDMYIPFSLLSPDPYEQLAPTSGSGKRGVVGRRFPWGVADPYNPDHCDFVRLRDSVFSEWRSELRLAARERWYETWRTSRLAKHTPRLGSSAGGGARQQGGVTPLSAVPREGRTNAAAAGGSPPPLPPPVVGYSPRGGAGHSQQQQRQQQQQQQQQQQHGQGPAGLGLYAGAGGHRQGVHDNAAY